MKSTTPSNKVRWIEKRLDCKMIQRAVNNNPQPLWESAVMIIDVKKDEDGEETNK